MTFLTDWFANDRIANVKTLFHIILSECNNVTSEIKNDKSNSSKVFSI